MIFSRYSSPFDLLDGYIQTGQFTSFISQFIDIHEEEKVWEIWLNKATGMGRIQRLSNTAGN